MNRELTDLLEDASADVREVDFAERAWQGAALRRRRTRRRTVAAVAAAAAVVLTAGGYLATRPPAPQPAVPTPSIIRTTAAQQVAPDGTPYLMAPPAGSEGSLPAMRYSLFGADRVDPTGPRRDLADVVADPKWRADLPTAVFLEAVDAEQWSEATTFRPVFVHRQLGLVVADLPLRLVPDGNGDQGMPLSTGSLSMRRAAFAQPGQVVVLDLITGQASRYAVPSQTAQYVRWSGFGSDTVLVSGEDGAWSINVSEASPKAEKLPTGYAGTDDVIAVDPKRGPSLVSWKFGGLRQTSVPVRAPVSGLIGTTISSNLVASSGVEVDGLGRSDGPSPSQGVLVVPLYDPSARRLLVMGGTPMRGKGCCDVVGLAEENEVLFTSSTAEGVWLLRWDVEAGTVARIVLLEAKASVPPALSLGSLFH